MPKKKSEKYKNIPFRPNERVPIINGNDDEKSDEGAVQHLLVARKCTEVGEISAAFWHTIFYFRSLKRIEDAPISIIKQFDTLFYRFSLDMDCTFHHDDIVKAYLAIINLFPKHKMALNCLGNFLFKLGEFEIAKSYFRRAVAEGFLPAEKNLLHLTWHQVPRWHFRMLNDTIRNQAYQQAIFKAISNNYKNVLDIGCGCGLLSLIAASGGAKSVTAFEENKTLGEMAIKLVKENNYESIVNVNLINSTDYKQDLNCNLITAEIFDVAVFGENALKSLVHAIENFTSQSQFQVIPLKAKIYITGITSDEISSKYRYIRNLDCLNLNSNMCITLAEPEPYDSELLKNYTAMTDTLNILDVEFDNLAQLKQMLSNEFKISLNPLTCLEDGIIHSLVLWYELYLDEDIIIITKPDCDNTAICWEQAIFHFKHPLNVKKGDLLPLRLNLVDDRIQFSTETDPPNCENCFYVSKELLTFLNDETLVSTIIETTNQIEDFKIDILDLAPVPLLGILAGQKGAVVHHVYRDSRDLRLFEYIIGKNKLDVRNFIFVPEVNADDYISNISRIDLVFTDFIRQDGSWNGCDMVLRTRTDLAKYFLPKKIIFRATVIYSEYIDFCNKVDDKKALSFGIDQHLNAYTGTEHPFIDGDEELKPIQLTNILKYVIPMNNSFSIDVDVTVNRPGIANAVLYWFEFQFTNDENVCAYSTLTSGHYNRSCIILPELKELKMGDVLKICLQSFESEMKVSLEDNV